MIEPLRFLSEASDGVWAVDTNQRIILWNHAAENLLGYAPKRAIGQLCYHLLAGRGVGGETACRPGCSVIQRAHHGESSPGCDLLVRHCKGQMLQIGVSIVVIPQAPEADKPAAIAHIFRKLRTMTYEPLPLRICLLGKTAVWRMDGSPVGGPYWHRAKVRALLALLALHHGQPLHREAVLEAMWPHLRRPAALRNLNTTIHSLRRSLEPGLERASDSSYIRNGSDSYVLASNLNHWLDIRYQDIVHKPCYQDIV
jgi:PAS fold